MCSFEKPCLGSPLFLFAFKPCVVGGFPTVSQLLVGDQTTNP